MKSIKRIFGLACLLTVMLACMVFHASAAEVTASGYCGGEGDGTNLSWTLYSDGTLTITGTGTMADFTYNTMPWYSKRSSVKNVIVDNNVTTIGWYAFEACGNLTSVTIGNGVTVIGIGAFENCYNLSSVTIPNSVKEIERIAFYREYDRGDEEPIDIYFEGDAPITTDHINSEPPARTFCSFDVLHYNPSTTGWTDSEAYDAEAGTWNGYKIATWLPLPKQVRDRMSELGVNEKHVYIYGAEALVPIGTHFDVVEDSEAYTGKAAFCDSNTLGNPNAIGIAQDVKFRFNQQSTNWFSVPVAQLTANSGKGYKLYAFEDLVVPDTDSSVYLLAFNHHIQLRSIMNWARELIGETVDVYLSMKVTGKFNWSRPYGAYWIDRLIVVDRCDNYTATEKIHVEASCTKNKVVEYLCPVCDVSFGVVEQENSKTDHTYGEYVYNPDLGYSVAACTNPECDVTKTNVLAMGTCGGEGDGTNLTWMLDVEGTLTITGTGAMADFYNSTPVWSSYRSSIKNVIIDNGVTSIGRSAFYSCYNLSSVTIGDGVTSIGDHAFTFCDRLISLVLPDSVISIGRCAFRCCYGLTSITIPAGVTSIDVEAFDGCSGLTTIYVDAENQTFCDIDGVLFSKDQTTLRCCPAGKTGTYAIPNGVTTIGKCAFYTCEKLTSVVIPNSVTTIGVEAFYECTRLADITIPSSVTTINDHAFAFCHGLTSVTIPASVTSIGGYAFEYCGGLTSVTIGISGGSGSNSTTTIGSCAFRCCEKLKTVILGSKVASIVQDPFDDCSTLTEISVAVENQTYCDVAGVLFSKDKTQLICFPAGKTGAYVIPDSVTTIGNSAFSDCIGLTAITIGNNVAYIDFYAFSGCDGLTSVVIPDSVTAIAPGAYQYCNKLSDVYFEGNAPTVYPATSGSVTFSANSTLYYIPGMTGWTDSETHLAPAYWNGCKLAIWEERCVAKIGDVLYGQLSDAVEAVVENGTIELLADTDEAVKLSKVLTINRNGFTASGLTDGRNHVILETDDAYTTVEWNAGSLSDNGGALVLDGIINIKRYFDMEGSDMTADEIVANGGMLVWSEGDMPADEAEAVYGTQSAEEALVYEASTEEFSSKYEVNSWEYGKTFYFRPYVTQYGKYAYGDVVKYSVLDYCEGRFARSSNENLKSTLVALLNYGSAAQTYFDLNTEVLANAKMDQYLSTYPELAAYNELNWDDAYLTEVEPAPEEMTSNFVKTENTTDNGKSLILKGAISVKLYAGVGKDESLFDDTCDAKFYFWTEEDYRSLDDSGRYLTKKNASYVVDATYAYSDKYGCEYSATSEGIYAMYYGDTLYAAFCATDVNGNEYCSGIVTYSPETYAASKITNGKVETVDPVVQWMVVYGERAKTYLG